MATLEYSRLYDFPHAAKALGVSLEWVEKHVGNAIKQGMISNKNGKERPVLVSGNDLKTVAMKRYSQLEAELLRQAAIRIQARDRAILEEEAKARGEAA